jgi:dihydrofolate synthase/folylpolyglutamate synthase
MSEYERTERWLYALEMSLGMDLKLERVREALRLLGDPQARLRCLHVAGTNGKGSVVAILAAVLGAAGYRVGLYTSPHLERLSERIRIGAEEISRDEIVTLTAEIRRRVFDAGIQLTFFEVITALAFVYFQRRQIEVAVVEVGLGGRLDATNLIDPLVTAITTVGLDHTRWLGSSLTDIAAEKGGIIKPGCPVVLGRIAPQPEAVLKKLADERRAPLYRAAGRLTRAAGDRLDFRAAGFEFCDLHLGLRGSFQLDNCAVALTALAVVREHLPVSEEAVRAGLTSVRWPGRLEVFETEPRVILDGAHNPDAIAALVNELPALSGERPLHVLFAAMGDKDWPAMVEALAPHCATATVTEVLPPRAAAAESIATAFGAHCPAAFEADPLAALEQVRRGSAAGDVILVTGSLFLIGAVRDRICKMQRRSEVPST